MEDHVISAHLVPFILKFCGEEFSFPDPGHEDVVAFPEIEAEQLFVWNPFQPALGGIDQLA